MGFLLPRPECAGDLDGHGRFGEVDREVSYFTHDKHVEGTFTEGIKEFFAFFVGGLAINDRGVKDAAEFFKLVNIGTDHQGWLAFVLLY